MGFFDNVPIKPCLYCKFGFILTAEGQSLIIENEKKKTNEIVLISNIQSFSLKEPTALSEGSISFKTAEAADAHVNLGWGISTSIGTERKFVFSKSELSSAQRLHKYIVEYPSSLNTSQEKSSTGADELRKFKALLDDGIITQEEFDAKKKQILGL